MSTPSSEALFLSMIPRPSTVDELLSKVIYPKKKKSRSDREQGGRSNAFALFHGDFSEQRKGSPHSVLGSRKTMKIAGMVWKYLTDDQQKVWKDLATEVNERRRLARTLKSLSGRGSSPGHDGSLYLDSSPRFVPYDSRKALRKLTHASAQSTTSRQTPGLAGQMQDPAWKQLSLPPEADDFFAPSVGFNVHGPHTSHTPTSYASTAADNFAMGSGSSYGSGNPSANKFSVPSLDSWAYDQHSGPTLPSRASLVSGDISDYEINAFSFMRQTSHPEYFSSPVSLSSPSEPMATGMEVSLSCSSQETSTQAVHTQGRGSLRITHARACVGRRTCQQFRGLCAPFKHERCLRWRLRTPWRFLRLICPTLDQTTFSGVDASLKITTGNIDVSSIYPDQRSLTNAIYTHR